MVDHKKITLSPEDLKKLQALLSKAEESVDAMSDDELLAEEKALEARIRKLPEMQGQKASSQDKEQLDATWQKLQKRLTAAPEELFTAAAKDNVVSFQRTPTPKKTNPWPALGIVAAAALALFIFYPSLKTSDQGSVDPNNLLTKGTESSGAHNYTAFCDVNVRGPNETDVEEAGVGQGYEVDANSRFSISVSCDKAGYFHVWSKSPGAAEIRNSKVEANTRSFIVEDGKPFEFSLSGSPEITLEMALTSAAIPSSANLLEVMTPAEKIGAEEVTWTDTVIFRENK